MEASTVFHCSVLSGPGGTLISQYQHLCLLQYGGSDKARNAEAEQMVEVWLQPMVWEPVSFPFLLCPNKATLDAHLTLLHYVTPTPLSYEEDSFLEEILSLM